MYTSFDKEDEDSTFVILRGHRKKYIAVKELDLNILEDTIDNILSGSGVFKKLLKKLNFVVRHEDLWSIYLIGFLKFYFDFGMKNDY